MSAAWANGFGAACKLVEEEEEEEAQRKFKTAFVQMHTC